MTAVFRGPIMRLINLKRTWGVQREAMTLYLALRDRRVPWPAKLIAGAIALYVLSPIDLIPDFIPVLGQLDDLVLLPLGFRLVAKRIPPPVLEDLRQEAERRVGRLRRKGALAIAAFFAFWIVLAALLVWWIV